MIFTMGTPAIARRRIASSSHWSANGATLDAYDTYLTASWNLENVNDSKGSNTLTNNNTCTFVSGKINNAVSLNGSDQYLSISDNADTSPTTSVAMSLWFYTDNNTAVQGIAGKDGTYFMFFAPGSTYLYWRVYQSDATSKLLSTTTTPTNSTWYHLLGIADATAGYLYFYINGSSVGTPLAYDGSIYNDGASFYIGRILSFYTDGLIDACQLWKNPVFANQTAREAFVSALYNSGTGVSYT